MLSREKANRPAMTKRNRPSSTSGRRVNPNVSSLFSTDRLRIRAVRDPAQAVTRIYSEFSRTGGTVINRSRIGDNRLQCGEAIGQRRRTRLQDQRRFDLVNGAAPDRGDAVEAGPLRHLVGTKLLAAP